MRFADNRRWYRPFDIVVAPWIEASFDRSIGYADRVTATRSPIILDALFALGYFNNSHRSGAITIRNVPFHWITGLFYSTFNSVFSVCCVRFGEPRERCCHYAFLVSFYVIIIYTFEVQLQKLK